MNTFSPLKAAGFTFLFTVLGLLPATAEQPVAFPVAAPTAAVVPSTVAIAGITMATSQSEQGTAATATVTVLDRAGQPVVGAYVTAIWSGLTASKGSALTNRQGRATFHSARSASQGTFVFDVGTINAASTPYNPALNAKSQERISSIGTNEVSHVSVTTK